MRQIAETIAGIRLDEVEHRMRSNPEDYPGYTDALEAERIICKALLEKGSVDKLAVDQLVSTLSAQGAAIGVEMYITGFLDGGHTAQAFQGRKLPDEE